MIIKNELLKIITKYKNISIIIIIKNRQNAAHFLRTQTIMLIFFQSLELIKRILSYVFLYS